MPPRPNVSSLCCLNFNTCMWFCPFSYITFASLEHRGQARFDRTEARVWSCRDGEPQVCAWHPGICESSCPTDSGPESFPGKKDVALNQARTCYGTQGAPGRGWYPTASCLLLANEPNRWSWDVSVHQLRGTLPTWSVRPGVALHRCPASPWTLCLFPGLPLS